MAMKIYGSPMSRASRVMWCAKELGVPFEHIDVPWEKLKGAEFLAINPNGKVPGFQDGDLTLFESLAINLYIAKKYGTDESGAFVNGILDRVARLTGKLEENRIED